MFQCFFSVCFETMPVFNNLKTLRIRIRSSSSRGWKALPLLLNNCPHLETLHINVKKALPYIDIILQVKSLIAAFVLSASLSLGLHFTGGQRSLAHILSTEKYTKWKLWRDDGRDENGEAFVGVFPVFEGDEDICPQGLSYRYLWSCCEDGESLQRELPSCGVQLLVCDSSYKMNQIRSLK